MIESCCVCGNDLLKDNGYYYIVESGKGFHAECAESVAGFYDLDVLGDFKIWYLFDSCGGRFDVVIKKLSDLLGVSKEQIELSIANGDIYPIRMCGVEMIYMPRMPLQVTTTEELVTKIEKRGIS